MRYYFSYGSNMDRAHMKRLCRQAEPLGPAQLNHHRFFIAFGGYASVAPKRGEIVYGVLWRISARDRAALDAYEEVENGLYQPAALPVHWNGKLLRALVYVANDARPAQPSASYRDRVLDAARSWMLPEHYLQSIASEMKAP